MAVEYFDSGNSGFTEDLPWIKDYVRNGGDASVARTVLSCYVGAKGILVLTAKWKGFVRKGTQSHNQLLEALIAYAAIQTGTYVLMASGLPDGKCRVGIDRDVDMMYWTREGDAYHQKSNTGVGAVEQAPIANPLLDFPSPSPQTTIPRTGGRRLSPKAG